MDIEKDEKLSVLNVSVSLAYAVRIEVSRLKAGRALVHRTIKTVLGECPHPSVAAWAVVSSENSRCTGTPRSSFVGFGYPESAPETQATPATVPCPGPH